MKQQTNEADILDVLDGLDDIFLTDYTDVATLLFDLSDYIDKKKAEYSSLEGDCV